MAFFKDTNHWDSLADKSGPLPNYVLIIYTHSMCLQDSKGEEEEIKVEKIMKEWKYNENLIILSDYGGEWFLNLMCVDVVLDSHLHCVSHPCPVQFDSSE